MKKINQRMLIFLGLVFLVFAFSMSVLQSREFSSFVSSKISEIIGKKLNVKVKFEGITFKVIPLGVSLRNVSVLGTNGAKAQEDLVKFDVSFKYLNLSFYYSKVFQKDFTVKKIELAGGTIKVDAENKTKKEEEDWDNLSLSQLVGKIREKLPINISEIFIRNAHVIFNQQKVEVKRLQLDLSPKSLQVIGALIPPQILAEKLAQGQKWSNELKQELKIDYLKFNALLLGDKIALNELQIRNNKDELTFNGVINIPGEILLKKLSLKDMTLEGTLSAQFQAKKLNLVPSLKEDLDLVVDEGLIQAEGTVKGRFPNFVVQQKLKIAKLKSSLIDLEAADVDWEFKNNQVILQKGTVNSLDQGNLSFHHPVLVWDLKTKNVEFENFKLHLGGFKFPEIIKPLNQEIDFAEGDFTGELQATLKDKTLKLFDFKNLTMKNFHLGKRGKDQAGHKILDLAEFGILSDEITYDFSKKVLLADLQILLGHSKVALKGFISPKKIEISGHAAHLSFGNIHKVGPVDVAGEGAFNFELKGKGKELKADFNLDLNAAKLWGFHLGEIKLQIALDLQSEELKIIKGEGKFQQTQYAFAGDINFNQKKFSLEVSVGEGFVADFPLLLYPLLEEKKDILKNVTGKLQTHFTVWGPIDPNQISIKGDVQTSQIQIYKEVFESLEANFEYSKKAWNITDIILKKDKGMIVGTYTSEPSQIGQHFDFVVGHLVLSELQFLKEVGINLEGRLNGWIRGGGKKEIDEIDVSLDVSKSSLMGKKVGDSNFKLVASGDYVNFKGSFLGEGLDLESKIKYRNIAKGEKKSWIKGNLRTNEVVDFVSIFFIHNITDQHLKGGIDIGLNAAFDLNDLQTMDLDLEFNELYFLWTNIELSIQKKFNQVSVKNGEIKKMKLVLEGEGGEVELSGSGRFDQEYDIKTHGEWSLSLAEIFSEAIMDAKGKIVHKINIHGNGRRHQSTTEGRIYGKDLSFGLEGILGRFEDIQLQSTVLNNSLLVDKFNGKYSSGNFEVDGKLLFSGGTDPALDLNYILNNINLPFFENSSLTVTGKGRVQGHQRPYLLSGNLITKRGKLIEELKSFKTEATNNDVLSRYGVRAEEIQKKDLFELQVAFGTIEGLFIKNELAEMILEGSMLIKGTPAKPRLQGTVSVYKDSGKFYFKSSDFQITKGEISFQDEGTGINPGLNFRATSQQSDYEIILNVRGTAKAPVFELSSNPNLSHQDILSLLALGFTGDVSKNLTDDERKNLASMGMGGVLFEKFKIKDELKQSLGVKIGLISEMFDEEKSFLAGRSFGDGAKVDNTQKTATKVQILRKVSENLDASFSSVLGESTNQGKSFNLKYRIKNGLSLEGVHELKQGIIGEPAPISTGADIKLKWTFQ